MPLSWGGAISYSPLLYRPRERWADIATLLRGSVPQSAAARQETAAQLDESASKIEGLFAQMRESIERAGLDALIVLAADRCRSFDEANFPQVHVYAGESVWSDTALQQLGEKPMRRTHACDLAIADHLIEELFDAGFDVAESHGDFTPVGDPLRGAVPALLEPLARLECDLPIIPVHLNCHMAPAIRGARAAAFGGALGAAAARSRRRIGVLASGGLSGDPGGYLAGWIDPEMDEWVLRQLETSRSQRIVPMFDIDSHAMRGNSAEIRLWAATGAALESVRASPKTLGYVPVHCAAAGIGFFTWEVGTCL